MMVILIGRMQQETLIIMKKLSFIDKLLLCYSQRELFQLLSSIRSLLIRKQSEVFS